MSYTINPSNFKFTDGEYIASGDFADYISDNVSLSEDQWISFDCNGVEVVVNYKLSVSASIYEDRGDYWTPTHKSLDISDISCEIKDIYIDGYELELNSDIESIFLKEIKKIYKM
jgi:hypothetical protein